MSESILIRGGLVIDPSQQLEEVCDVLLSKGLVEEIAAPGIIKRADKTITAKGMIVSPGFIDLHVHLREPGQTHKETISTGTAAAAAGGFTSVCAMPNTKPVNDSPAITRWMQDAERNSVVNVFPIAAATIGSMGEKLTDFSALIEAGAVAVSDDGKPILDDSVMRECLELAAKLQIPVIQHAEDTRMTANCPMNAGPLSFRLGLRGQPSEAEWKVVERDINLAQMVGGRIHVAHASTAESVELVRQAKAQNVLATAEAAPHHFMFTDENCVDYDTRYKMNPPLRSAADREAVLVGLADGTIDAIATDHAPHALYEKFVEFDRSAFGITGLEIALAATITYVHRTRKVPMARIVELLSTNPAKIVGLEGRGTLRKGAHADVTIFDPKKRWTYDEKKTRSKSRNCPYDGMEFYGKVVKTIVGGKVVFE